MTLLTFPLSSCVSWAGHSDTCPSVSTVPFYTHFLSPEKPRWQRYLPEEAGAGGGGVQSEHEGGDKVSYITRLHLNFPWPHCSLCAAQH